MARLKDAPIGRKLTILLSLTSAIALVLAAGALVSYDLLTFREGMAGELETIAEVVGSNVTAPLLFDDAHTASDALGALKAERNIARAILLYTDGRMFARFEPSERLQPRTLPWPENDGHLFYRDRVRLRHTILLDSEPVGVLLIESDMTEVTERLLGYGASVLVLLGISFLLALVVSTRAKHGISRPILNLVEAARTISRTKNYDVDVRKEGNDELGLLTDSFNDMLTQIRCRDTELSQARDALAQHVSSLKEEIVERQRAEGELLKLSMAVQQSPASVVITDANAAIEYVNPKFEEVSGYTAEQASRELPDFLRFQCESEEQYEQVRRTLEEGREWKGEFRSTSDTREDYWEHVSIVPIRSQEGSTAHLLIVKEDITLRKQYEESLHRQANFDHLTGLPNRGLALDRLSQVVLHCERSGKKACIVLIDLDNFKMVNDTLGHLVGDQLLVETGRRLSAQVRATDTVARLGGDEFLIIMNSMEKETSAEMLVEKVLEVFKEPLLLEDRQIYVSASVGITVAPDDGTDPYVLLRGADTAMYGAKETGGNSYKFFTWEMNQRAIQRLELQSKLRSAIAQGDLAVHFQPIIEVSSGETVGGEALLRWTDPDLGPVSPGEFIPVAEETGLIMPIGDWVLDAACREAKRWQVESGEPLMVAVNVSTRQFQGSDIVGAVARALDCSGLEPEFLHLEVTEGLLLGDVPGTAATLGKLSDLGVQLSIDDFGTGFSSLGYLKRFPFNTLKIDRSFVSDVVTDPSDASLVEAIIAMARSLGLKVVGEGVETKEQLQFLSRRECDVVQGFLFSPAIPSDAFLQWIKRQVDESRSLGSVDVLEEGHAVA